MSSLPEISSCFCFADDTKLSFATSDFYTGCQRDLNKIIDWSSEKFLEFNSEKYVYIHISEAPKCDFKIDQISLQKMHNTTDLGVEICSDLKWSRHIRNKLTKVQRISIVSDTMCHIAIYHTKSSKICTHPACYLFSYKPL